MCDRAAEAQIFLAFKQAAQSRYSDCPGLGELSSWWSLMQRHGVPTRLLDWSTSPLVGAFFAVREKIDGDAAIWVLDPYGLNEKTGKQEIYPLDHRPRVTNHFSSACNPKKPSPNDVLAVMPSEVHLRLMVQHSRFTIHGTNTALEEWSTCESCLRKIVIEEGARARLKESLRRLGIHESTLFPDLDGLARHLCEQFALTGGGA